MAAAAFLQPVARPRPRMAREARAERGFQPIVSADHRGRLLEYGAGDAGAHPGPDSRHRYRRYAFLVPRDTRAEVRRRVSAGTERGYSKRPDFGRPGLRNAADGAAECAEHRQRDSQYAGRISQYRHGSRHRSSGPAREVYRRFRSGRLDGSAEPDPESRF